MVERVPKKKVIALQKEALYGNSNSLLTFSSASVLDFDEFPIILDIYHFSH